MSLEENTVKWRSAEITFAAQVAMPRFRACRQAERKPAGQTACSAARMAFGGSFRAATTAQQYDLDFRSFDRDAKENEIRT
ncbi:MAG TPA: hypothetical protein VNI36_02190 [Candidatus Dormibacteraeota bacterium]|nr:hypothetical protein [Candidatus Dormibacteraeota bacterium]